MEGLKFALLSGGTGYNDIAWNFQGYGLATADDRQGSKDVWQAFSYLYTVICHPTAGYVLFDVGLGPGEECDRRPAEHRRINPVEVRRDQYVDEGLKKLGLTVDDISAIVISHCHWDHIGGLEFFKGTRAIRNVYVPYADFAHALVQTHPPAIPTAAITVGIWTWRARNSTCWRRRRPCFPAWTSCCWRATRRRWRDWCSIWTVETTFSPVTR